SSPCAAMALLTARGLGRAAPASDETPSPYATGARRKSRAPARPQSGCCALLPEPSIDRSADGATDATCPAPASASATSGFPPGAGPPQPANIVTTAAIPQNRR